jgi:hypothetical protein
MWLPLFRVEGGRVRSVEGAGQGDRTVLMVVMAIIAG